MAAVKYHAQKALAAVDPVRNAARDVRHLPWVELDDSPFGIVGRVAAELEPDFVFVEAAMKPALLPFQVVNVDAEFIAGVQHRRPRAALAGHAGEIIEGADFLEPAPPLFDAADQLRALALDPDIRRRVPKAQVLQDAVIIRSRGAVVRGERVGVDDFESAFGQGFLRIDTEVHRFLRHSAQTQTFPLARGSVRDPRRNQRHLSRLELDSAVLGFDGARAGELKEDQIIIRGAGQPALFSFDLLRRDS